MSRAGQIEGGGPIGRAGKRERGEKDGWSTLLAHEKPRAARGGTQGVVREAGKGGSSKATAPVAARALQ